MKYCFKCGARVPPGNTICGNCLTSLYSLPSEKICIYCGVFHPKNANFCPVYGKKLETAGLSDGVTEVEEEKVKPISIKKKEKRRLPIAKILYLSLCFYFSQLCFLWFRILKTGNLGM
jgi:RNA polymerase subunit RPABC4/transcription elongation factor Spt4